MGGNLLKNFGVRFVVVCGFGCVIETVDLFDEASERKSRLERRQ